MSNASTPPIASYWTLPLVGALSLAIFAVAFRLDQPMLMIAAGAALLAGLFAWSQPFIICALFVALSYFRLPEAYPALEPFKLALLLGTAAVGLVVVKALMSDLRVPGSNRSLKAYCLLSMIACIGLAVPFSFLRSSGTVGLDALMIPAIMLTVAFCIVVWTMLLSATAEQPLPVNMQFFAAFMVWICITTIVSKIPGESFDWWATITWKVTTMTLATAWLVRRERDLLNASNIFIVSGVLIALVVFYNKIHGLSLVQGTRVSIGRVVSEDPEAALLVPTKILSDPNDLSLILMFPLAFALARVAHRRGVWEAALCAVACGIILMAIVFTQSRGAAIGVLVIFAMILLQRYRSAVLGLLALVIAGPLMVGAMNLANRESSGYEEVYQGSLDDSAEHRLEAWKTAINMAAARPVTGIGISNFAQMYYTYTNYWRNREFAVHSMWFQVLGELGFVGLGLFVGMIWTSFTVNAETTRWLERAHAPPFTRATAIGLQASLAGTCASGTFLSQAYTWPVYILVALIAALAMQTRSYAPGRFADDESDRFANGRINAIGHESVSNGQKIPQ